MNRERAKQLAAEIVMDTIRNVRNRRDTAETIADVENVLRHFAIEVLTAEPDAAMVTAGAEIVAVLELSEPNYTMGKECRAVWKEMSAHRAAALRSPEGGE